MPQIFLHVNVAFLVYNFYHNICYIIICRMIVLEYPFVFISYLKCPFFISIISYLAITSYIVRLRTLSSTSRVQPARIWPFHVLQ
jgi:hypothetical protein